MQPRPFEEWIEKGHEQDTNLCSAYARPADERSLVRRGEGYNQGFLYTLQRRKGMWRALSLATFGASPVVRAVTVNL